MLSRAREVFVRWAAADLPPEAINRFRIAFASIWLLYDLLDLSLQGTAHILAPFGSAPPLFTALQVSLIVAEALLLMGWRASDMAFLCFGLRAFEAWRFFGLNDFYYASITALLLSQCRMARDPHRPGTRMPEPRWVRDLLIWQCAWMYFATATLKTSAPWLAGGHLYVRHEFLARVLHWPYPAFFDAALGHLAFHALIAPVVVAAELTLAALLAFRGPWWAALGLALGIHGYAAVGMNVWFFGASMVAQIGFLAPRKGDGQRRASAVGTASLTDRAPESSPAT